VITFAILRVTIATFEGKTMRLGYDLTIEQTQKLVMTPELIQAIQILQFNTQELDLYVQEQLLINPVLEPEKQSETQDNADGDTSEGEENLDHKEKVLNDEPEERASMSEADWREYIKDKGYDDISYRQWEYKKEDNDYSFEQHTTSDITLLEHLLFQLQFAEIRKSCKAMGRYIIESLDENGYMTLSNEEISKQFNAPIDKVLEVMDVIHTFEPPGVGAQDLRECLRIQLEHSGNLDETTEKIVMNHLEDVASNRLGNIAKELGVNITEVQDISDLIKCLEPKPGRQFASQVATRYIVPDVQLEKIHGEYVVSVNESSVPRLMISSYYEKLLVESENDANLSKYLSGRFNSAMWLIKSIELRKQTIQNVVKSIVKHQRGFFDHGTKYLRTLTLKQIAEEVGIHESTVSRSINGKYMQTPRGVFELKYFFTSGVSDSSGESISSKSIKTFIKEIIENEDSKAPFSDQDMVEMMDKKGIKISRRTIAKYRDEMNIASSSKRRRY
jgi:RNA polymerase sigma-54 factor